MGTAMGRDRLFKPYGSMLTCYFDQRQQFETHIDIGSFNCTTVAMGEVVSKP
jgi:hypothetical protein